MGPIVDRSQETLVTSDNAIIAMRKVLLKATYAIEQGQPAPGADPLTHRGVRAYDCIVPRGTNWQDAVADHVTDMHRVGRHIDRIPSSSLPLPRVPTQRTRTRDLSRLAG